jgi:hypothetical protein
MTEPWEREYFGLARDWLLCRLALMDGRNRAYCPCGWQIGELDYAIEMDLLLKERYGNKPHLLRRTAAA